ncbi:YchJ family protein [Noviherbaspirillum aridicola]|uniref:UPF0225 protein NCCP691_18170 n=1 Tax=Noviherbaspirillum aridicola TaxID=2849687 RepID=A0ABQ4Q3N4_9BURK|nr:YchJ family metal-binding protein [Noviherbaspirillum aridicola]GIZ51803.1 UPF0225 protein [Noviherbaspirillum aridicola]
MKKTASNACPCGGTDYAACCGRYLDGGELPQTAEQLMRSRYTAYTLGREAYLRDSWHPTTRPQEPIVQDDGVKWLGLDVRRHVPQGDEATVEFVARCKLGGRAQRLHEVSRFVREGGRWYYVDGSFPGSG